MSEKKICSAVIKKSDKTCKIIMKKNHINIRKSLENLYYCSKEERHESLINDDEEEKNDSNLW